MLSEFAGAAAELDGAIVVNPYDINAVADGIHRALSMAVDERRPRMETLRRRVRKHDIHAWAGGFLEALDEVRSVDRRSAVSPPGAGLPGMAVDIVSGRPRETLEAWLGHLPVSLWAEHGFWQRRGPGWPWQAAAAVPPDWLDRIRPILDQFTASTPGSLVETTSASIAWHYRQARVEFGARQAHELRLRLRDALCNQPFEVLEGSKVIEIRLRGVSKAVVAHRVKAEPDTAVMAIGDDRTDEDLVRALPPSSITVAVGRRPTRARFRLDDYRAVRHVLRSLVANPALPDAPWERHADLSAPAS